MRLSAFEHTMARGRELLGSRTIWNVNSTAFGGGVAEMLRSLIGYARGAGSTAAGWSSRAMTSSSSSPSACTTGCTGRRATAGPSARRTQRLRAPVRHQRSGAHRDAAAG